MVGRTKGPTEPRVTREGTAHPTARGAKIERLDPDVLDVHGQNPTTPHAGQAAADSFIDDLLPTEPTARQKAIELFLKRRLLRDARTGTERNNALVLIKWLHKAVDQSNASNFEIVAQNILSTLSRDRDLDLPQVIHDYLLHSPAKHATNRSTMSTETDSAPPVTTDAPGTNDPALSDLETLIELARTNASGHPKPDTPNELQAIATEASQLQTTLDELRSLDIPPSRLEAEVAIKGLHNIATRSEDTAKALGLHAISQGYMSRVGLAELLGVHQNTIARWYNEAEHTTEEPR